MSMKLCILSAEVISQPTSIYVATKQLYLYLKPGIRELTHS